MGVTWSVAGQTAEIDVHRVRSLFIRVGSRRFLFLSILLSSNFKGVRILLPSRLSPTEPVVMDSWFCSHGKFTYGQLGTGPTHTCCKFRLVRKYADGRCIIIRITHIYIHWIIFLVLCVRLLLLICLTPLPIYLFTLLICHQGSTNSAPFSSKMTGIFNNTRLFSVL